MANTTVPDMETSRTREITRAVYGRILLENGIIPDALTLSAMRVSRAEAQIIIARDQTPGEYITVSHGHKNNK